MPNPSQLINSWSDRLVRRENRTLEEKKSVQVNLRVTESIATKLEELAELYNTSKTDVVEQLIEIASNGSNRINEIG